MSENSDREITCRDCSTPFVFTTGEQEFYASKQLNPPVRCKPCRDVRKGQRPQQSLERNTVPFQAREENPPPQTVEAIRPVQQEPRWVPAYGVSSVSSEPDRSQKSNRRKDGFKKRDYEDGGGNDQSRKNRDRDGRKNRRNYEEWD